jgi:hypothetical protein
VTNTQARFKTGLIGRSVDRSVIRVLNMDLIFISSLWITLVSIFSQSVVQKALINRVSQGRVGIGKDGINLAFYY